MTMTTATPSATPTESAVLAMPLASPLSGLTISDRDQQLFARMVPLLVGDLHPPPAGDLAAAAEAYVEVVPQWWGLVFVLSSQAAKDLAAGASAVAGVVAAISAACSAVPAAQALAAAGGVISAIVGLYAVVIGVMDRGNGVYITALWPSILVPPSWIPTPR
jgi:hypothetical protein